ncbi:integrase core domain-containing protein [Hydrogenophaga luteola]|uniref:Integrase core domain-containing protein n=1 Tax=Hydrogenophaga luteola TaxID=1591122 RepID=A0ABV7W8A9_9BURK
MAARFASSRSSISGVARVYAWRPTSGCQAGAWRRRWTRSQAPRGWPKAITVDNGTEFTSKALDEWAYRRGIKLDYTRPGKPTDNGLIESFNGRLRDEFLNVNEFVTLHDAREKLKIWQDDYNHHRPHSSLGNLTPNEFVNNRSVPPNEAASL